MNPPSSIKLLALILLISSCTHHYYAPEEAHLLALEEKNDLNVSASIITPISNADGGSIQLGYSPIKHIGLQASGFYIDSALDETFDGDKSKGYSASAALGSYVNLRSKKNPNPDKSILLDLYGGVAIGKVKNIYSIRSNSTFDIQRIYGQVGIHFQDSLIGFDLVLKAGTLDFTDGLVIGSPPTLQIENIDLIEQNNLNLIGETSLRTFYKLNRGKFYFSFSHIIIKDQLQPFNNQFSIREHRFSNFTTTIGVLYDLNKKG